MYSIGLELVLSVAGLHGHDAKKIFADDYGALKKYLRRYASTIFLKFKLLAKLAS